MYGEREDSESRPLFDCEDGRDWVVTYFKDGND